MQFYKNQFQFNLFINKNELSDYERGFITAKLPEGTSLDEVDRIAITTTIDLDGRRIGMTKYEITAFFDRDFTDYDSYEMWSAEFEPEDSTKAEIFRRLMAASSAAIASPHER